jgi:hypothetical protein
MKTPEGSTKDVSKNNTPEELLVAAKLTVTFSGAVAVLIELGVKLNAVRFGWQSPAMGKITSSPKIAHGKLHALVPLFIHFSCSFTHITPHHGIGIAHYPCYVWGEQS